LKPRLTTKKVTTMFSTLSIRIPQLHFVGGYHALQRPIFPSYYKLWTPSDYEYVYQDANDTPFTWDDIDVPRRSPRLATKQKKNYKM